jgi:hypothetical protein
MTSYWNGIACVSRLAANVSCSYAYQCQSGLTCIVNETTLGIFSDVCRCPLGSYYVSGSGCVPSLNYSESCVGSYQCYELAPLSCRYNATNLTCLDTDYYTPPRCDCADNYFYNDTTGLCSPLVTRLGSCDSNCECKAPYTCLSNQCNCVNYYSSINQTCVTNLWFGDQCSNAAECEATPNAFMTCSNGTCRCNSTGVWNGTQCSFTINFRASCTTGTDCLGGLTCRDIKCVSGGKECSCSTTSYFSAASQSCIPCNGSAGNSFTRYVISYPTSDICVAVWDKSSSSGSDVTFAQADSFCSAFAPMLPGITPQLLSLHSTTELNCVARILRDQENQRTCGNNQHYYLGYQRANGTFYDGTIYSSVFPTPTLSASACLTYCSIDNSNGRLISDSCTAANSGDYGAICDYRVI